MKKISLSLMMVATLFMAISFTACKSKPKDATIKTAIETALKADPTLSSVVADVKDGVVSLSGTLADDATKTKVLELVKGVKGVKADKITDNLQVTPPVVITADDPLMTAVNDAVKSFPGISATVKDGVVSLVGAISKADRQKLMMAINALKPKKVDVAGLTNK